MNLLFVSILFCLPLILLAWLLPEKWQLFPLVLFTAIFIAYVSPLSLIILISTSLLTYFVLNNNNNKTTATLIIVLLTGSILIFFKVLPVLHIAGTKNWVFPLGLSYYSFRQIHYAMEQYKKKLPSHTFIEYLMYLFFLPTILVGPIHLFQPFLKDFRKRRWDSQLFSQGLERMLYGLVKVGVIGNYLLTFKLNFFCNSIAQNHHWLSTYLQVFKFSANAYFQFAGYSDIAIGLSMLFGFKIIENFNYPFLATNIAMFWKRWHISLSFWCREYVFYPFLAITRNGVVSILISMIVLSIWHEVSVRYLVWGLLHAAAISVWHKYENSVCHKFLSAYPNFQKVLGVFFTLNFVMLSFVLISEKSLSESVTVLQTMFLFK